jgi:F-type H+-transporting ATPase subunit alpha
MGVLLFAANEGFIDDVAVEKVGSFEASLLSYMKSNQADLMAKINEKGDFNDDIANAMREAIKSFKTTGSW